MDAANTHRINRYKFVINATPGWTVTGSAQWGGEYYLHATFTRGALHLTLSISNIHDWYYAKMHVRQYVAPLR